MATACGTRFMRLPKSVPVLRVARTARPLPTRMARAERCFSAGLRMPAVPLASTRWERCSPFAPVKTLQLCRSWSALTSIRNPRAVDTTASSVC